jgi:hypothetical protein
MRTTPLRCWVRLNAEFESHHGPFEAKAHAERCASKEKCLTEVLQDGLDSGYLEFTGGQWLAPARYIVFRSGKVRPWSAETLPDQFQREFN